MERVCAPGDSKTCTGLDASGPCQGAQVCADDGSRWQSCACSSLGTGGTTDGTGGSLGMGGGDGGQPETYIQSSEAGIIGMGAYDVRDTGGSTSTLTNPEAGMLCLNGTAKGHQNINYDTNWGG